MRASVVSLIAAAAVVGIATIGIQPVLTATNPAATHPDDRLLHLLLVGEHLDLPRELRVAALALDSLQVEEDVEGRGRGEGGHGHPQSCPLP